MKIAFWIIVYFFFALTSFGQNNTDSLDNKITTIQKDRIVKGEIIEFCNGLSLDFGEHPGLLIIKENETNNIYNILLDPYFVYDFKKNDTINIKIAPLSTIKNDSRDLELMCKSIGNIFVQKKD